MRGPGVVASRWCRRNQSVSAALLLILLLSAVAACGGPSKLTVTNKTDRDVVVTVDRDGDEEVWTREQWQETKEVVLDEWSTRGYYRELELPAAVDAAFGTATYGNGILVVALPVAETVRAARLQLVRPGEYRGERVGSVGHLG